MTDALEKAVRSAREVAVTVTTFDCGAVAGARYNPPLVICPHPVPLQVVPLSPQITTLFEVPLTTAVNCTCPLGCTCTVVGVRETEIDALAATEQDSITSKSHTTFTTYFMSSPSRTTPRPSQQC